MKKSEVKGMFGPGDVEYDGDGFPIVNEIGRPRKYTEEEIREAEAEGSAMGWVDYDGVAE